MKRFIVIALMAFNIAAHAASPPNAANMVGPFAFGDSLVATGVSPPNLNVVSGGPGQMSVKLFGATGYGTTSTATGSGTTLNLDAIRDFVKGNAIRVPQGGVIYSGGAAAIGTIVPINPGSTTRCYKVAPIGVDESIGAASAEVCTTTSNATLGLPVDTNASLAGNTLPITQPSGSVAVAIYAGASGAESLIATTTQTTWLDVGHAQSTPNWIPAGPPGSAIRGRLLTTIAAVNGNAITLANSGAAVAGVSITHDDTAALNAAIASGVPLYIPPGTFNIMSPLNFSVSNQNVVGANQKSSQLNGWGCFDTMNVTGRQGNYAYFGGDETNKACGKAISLENGTEAADRFSTMTFNNPYNGIAGTNTNLAIFDNMQFQTDHRGEYVAHVYSSGAFTELFYFLKFQTARSWSAAGVHIDGNVQSTFFDNGTSIQSMGALPELEIDNIIGAAAGGPSFVQFFNSALNNCNAKCVFLSGGMEQFYAFRAYMQGRPQNNSFLLSADSTVINVNLTLGDWFGAQNGALDIRSSINNITAVNFFSNVAAAGGGPEISLGATSYGTNISQGSNLPVINPTAAIKSSEAVLIASGAKLVSIMPGSYQGVSGCGVVNLSAPSNDIVIGGQVKGSPIDSVETSTSGVTISVASYPNIAKGVGALTSTICRSGPTSNYTDTLDTAAHYIAAVPNATTGMMFNIMYSTSLGSGVTATIATGIGITLNGTVTLGAGTGLGVISRLRLACVITSGTTVSCNGAGS